MQRVNPMDGYYYEWDSVNEKFIGPPLRRYEGFSQLELNKDGEVYDPVDKEPAPEGSVVDENGLVTIDDEEKLRLYVKEQMSGAHIYHTYDEGSKDLLIAIVALNAKTPLKEGGPEISFRYKYLLRQGIPLKKKPARIAFDALSGYVSSNPQPTGTKYRVYFEYFYDKLPGYSPKEINEIFRVGYASIKDKYFSFSVSSEKADDSIEFQLFSSRLIHLGKKGDPSYIEFEPTPFYVALCSACSLTTGGYGNIIVTSQFPGKNIFVEELYWYLEETKWVYSTYSSERFPYAKGVTFMPIEYLYDRLSVAPSNKPAHIRAKFDKAKSIFASIEQCDVDFDYEEITSSGKVTGYVISAIDLHKSNKTIIDTTCVDISDKALPDHSGSKEQLLADINQLFDMIY